MQHFRSGLTRLRTQMLEKLPDGPDIYGYAGVTKASLVAAIESAYTLSQEINENGEARFEIISLKRAGSDLYKLLKDFLEDQSSDGEKRVRFNDFLDGLSSLVEKIKLTYFIVSKNGIRDDEELARIKSKASELRLIADELQEQEESVKESLDSITAAIEGIKNNHKQGSQAITEIKEWHERTQTFHSEISEIHDAIEGWDKDIEERDKQFQSLSKKITELAADATSNRDRLREYAVQGEKQSELLKQTSNQHTELLEEIRQTLAGANRVGMAASFAARKDELRVQQGIWQGVFIIAVTSIVIAVWTLVLPTIASMTGEHKRWTELISELGLVSPLIWLGWFAAKQYAYTSKIREDYAFKSAAAMAYEGHKKAAREIDKDLERVLLEFSLYNMSQNPIRLYGDVVHGTPVHEIASELLAKFPNLKNMSAEAPGLGRLSMAAEDRVRKSKTESPNES